MSRHLLFALLLSFLLHAPAALAAMNLRVDSVAISGSPVNAGGTAQFTATVTNIGDELTVSLV